jgi:hypothetical protein
MPQIFGGWKGLTLSIPKNATMPPKIVAYEEQN